MCTSHTPFFWNCALLAARVTDPLTAEKKSRESFLAALAKFGWDPYGIWVQSCWDCGMRCWLPWQNWVRFRMASGCKVHSAALRVAHSPSGVQPTLLARCYQMLISNWKKLQKSPVFVLNVVFVWADSYFVCDFGPCRVFRLRDADFQERAACVPAINWLHAFRLLREQWSVLLLTWFALYSVSFKQMKQWIKAEMRDHPMGSLGWTRAREMACSPSMGGLLCLKRKFSVGCDLSSFLVFCVWFCLIMFWLSLRSVILFINLLSWFLIIILMLLRLHLFMLFCYLHVFIRF